MSPPDPFVTANGYKRVTMKPKDAAAVMGVCRATIWNWITAGKLRVIREGKLTLILVEDLQKIGAPTPGDCS